MAWGAIVGSIFSGLMSQQAADEQSDASEAAVREQRRQFNLLRNDLAPWRNVGRNALYESAGMMGLGNPERMRLEARRDQLREQLEGVDKYSRRAPDISELREVNPPGGGTEYIDDRTGQRYGSIEEALQASGEMTDELTPEYQEIQQELEGIESQLGEMPEGGDYSYDFQKTPGFQFRKEQGKNALDRSMAATGNRLSGRAIKAAQRYGQGLASEEFANRFNRLAGLSGTGQTAVNTGGQAGIQTGRGVANSMMAGGRARAGGYAGMNQAVQGGIGNYLSYQQNQNLLNNLGNNQGGGYYPSGNYGQAAGGR